MDKDTRNRIQRATQAARALLEHEYAEQLEGVFDIRLDGTIAAEPGEHLDAGQRVLRTKLVAAVEHQRATGMKKADAVAAHIREAAFTTLNRFVALKMLEARELVQECISRGDQSSGFKEFTGLAAGLVQLPDNGYRLYIEALFDEIGREVQVLFDRRDSASLLWPRRQALLDLLGILNAMELRSAWDKDEAIGWVYQYFNSDEERREMRSESQAPRNSRELAVRNQFFTPRYVVQFLTDNTLGRIWYEMRQGETRLRDLEYLVRRPNEIFLSDGDEAPGDAGTLDEKLTQEELLRRPIYVAFRAKKDPRDIRVLDPACGSGHFLLYAFDLLLTIYEEAWVDEGSTASEATGRRLRDDYLQLEELLAAIPGLILRHNLYGIDIDARCVQIAALALWVRAQRSYQDFGVARDNRPAIQKTNIVVAEPMPGDKELRREFVETLKPELGQLVDRVFERMELAGVAGSLLRIEGDIRAAVRQVLDEHGDLFQEIDENRWQRAEEAILRALRDYTELATNGRAFGRRLFAEDAARGLGFIDLCSQRYDVAVMNPPFGQGTSDAHAYVGESYKAGRFDLGAAFVERMVDCSGMLGVISNRTLWFGSRLEPFRSQLLDRGSISCAVDLGLGVLDAFVETVMWVTEFQRLGGDGLWIRATNGTQKASIVHSALSTAAAGAIPRHIYVWSADQLKTLPNTAFSYWVHPAVCRMLDRTTNVSTSGLETKQGLATMDNERFLRLMWEVERGGLGSRWYPYAKGGGYAPLVRDYHLLVDWAPSAHAAYSQRTGQFCCLITGQSERYAFRPGVTYSTRTSRFSAGFFPKGSLFDTKGSVVFHEDLEVGDPLDRVDVLIELCVFLNSHLAQYLLDLRTGASDAGKARDYSQSMIGALPYISLSEDDQVTNLARHVADRLAGIASVIPERSEYKGVPVAATIAELGRVLGEFAAETQGLLVHLFDQATLKFSAVLRLPVGVAEEASASVRRSHREAEHELLTGWSDELVAKLHLEALLGACMGPSDDSRPVLVSEALQTGRFEWASALPHFNETSMPQDDAGTILVDDPGHEDDLCEALETHSSWHSAMVGAQPSLFRQACSTLGYSPRGWAREMAFHSHLARRTLSRRSAPIYWQLATPSASYSVWLYYHRFTRDTLYQALNEYVTPKLRQEDRKLTSLTQDAGSEPSASQRKEVDAQERFVAELRSMHDEVALVAPLWSPDLDDGVIVNFSLLWRLVPQHRAWQEECRSTWDKLRKGDFDWAHLAMHLWPERVVPKCADDRSLAIAHGLEAEFWAQDSDGKWQMRKVDEATVKRLIAERSSHAVKDTLKNLLEAPAPSTGRRDARRASARGRAAGPKRRMRESVMPDAAVAIGGDTVDRVREAITGATDGVSRADVINATGITSSQWNTAIKALLADGSVTQTGERRGARYHLAGGDV